MIVCFNYLCFYREGQKANSTLVWIEPGPVKDEIIFLKIKSVKEFGLVLDYLNYIHIGNNALISIMAANWQKR